jgi:hypothetical protein
MEEEARQLQDNLIESKEKEGIQRVDDIESKEAKV